MAEEWPHAPSSHWRVRLDILAILFGSPRCPVSRGELNRPGRALAQGKGIVLGRPAQRWEEETQASLTSFHWHVPKINRRAQCCHCGGERGGGDRGRPGSAGQADVNRGSGARAFTIPTFAVVAHRTGSSLFRRAVTKKGKLSPRASGHGEAMRRARMKQDANAVKCQSFDGRKSVHHRAVSHCLYDLGSSCQSCA